MTKSLKPNPTTTCLDGPAPTAHSLRILANLLAEQHDFWAEQLARQDPPGLVDSRRRTEAHQEVLEVIRHGAAVALHEIEAAQCRMLDGSYGRCVDCAGWLARERLDALPYAARCVACQRSADD